MAQRAKIVLMAAEGLENQQIAEALSISERVEEIIEKTLTTKPENATHWTTRTMAEEVGVSHTTVRRIWNAHDIKPHLVHTFKLSRDPRFAEKLRDVIGLYLNPPEHAIVFCVDEKSQIQALDRTQPGLPLIKGRAETMTHDYTGPVSVHRNGVATLFAALNVLDGTVISSVKKRHRHQEYLEFLRQIKRSVPRGLDVHLIVDNYATHKHETVRTWLARNKRFHVHFTPTSSSWLNLVERRDRVCERRERAAASAVTRPVRYGPGGRPG